MVIFYNQTFCTLFLSISLIAFFGVGKYDTWCSTEFAIFFVDEGHQYIQCAQEQSISGKELLLYLAKRVLLDNFLKIL